MDRISKKIHLIKERGGVALGCSPLYPPLELFHSMGLTPVVLWGLKDSVENTYNSDRHLQNYTCSVARYLTELVLSDGGALFDGLFMYNACDTLRNLPEILKWGLKDAGGKAPIFRAHIPAVPLNQTDTSEYLKNEILNLIRELEEAFGTSFSEEKFRQSIGLYREM